MENGLTEEMLLEVRPRRYAQSMHQRKVNEGKTWEQQSRGTEI